MTEIYLWEVPESYPEKFMGIYDRKLSPDRFLFMRGNFVTESQISSKLIVRFSVEKKKLKKYDCLDSTAGSPIISNRAALLLSGLAKDDIQLIDVIIECKDGILEDYKLLNIISIVIGLDHEKSIYTKILKTEHIGGMKFVVYKPGCMGLHKLARDAEYKSHLLVTQEIFDVFEKEKITGVRLVTPKELYAEIYPGYANQEK